MSDDLERAEDWRWSRAEARGASRNSADTWRRALTTSYAKEGDGSMATTHRVNVVLVHGGFVDGSGWEGVYGI